jgi:hypothetical protein
MLDQELREAGFEVAGPFGSCAAALVWLNSERQTLEFWTLS